MPSATSLMVPSPPAATIRSAPRSMCSRAMAPAVFGPVVGTTVTVWPFLVRISTARVNSARPPPPQFARTRIVDQDSISVGCNGSVLRGKLAARELRTAASSALSYSLNYR